VLHECTCPGCDACVREALWVTVVDQTYGVAVGQEQLRPGQPWPHGPHWLLALAGQPALAAITAASSSRKNLMTTQDQINDALAVALQAIPKFIHFPIPDPEEYRVRLSADVTAHCRREGLLTATEFISYGASYLDGPGRVKLIPYVYDDEGRKHLAGVPALIGPRQYVPVPACEELQEEFMASKHPHHPLHRTVPLNPVDMSRSLIG